MAFAHNPFVRALMRSLTPAWKTIIMPLEHRFALPSTSNAVTYNVRWMSKRKGCKKPLKTARCSKEREKKGEICKDRDNLIQGKRDCGTGKEKLREKKSMWYNPECCNDPCKDMVPRFDDLYYAPSNKYTAKYQQTWAECPDLIIRPKKICCFEKVKYPQMEKRPRKDRPKTACASTGKCKLERQTKCAKIVLPGCRKTRKTLKCHYRPGASGCKKTCAPQPAFSECLRRPSNKKRPVECGCLKQVHLCEVIELDKKNKRNKKIC